MPLRDAQKALADWIRAPEGVASALAGDALPDRARANLEALVRSDATLDATARLEIYANAYFYRVLGVLADDYEALRGLLGEALFNDLVTSYLLVEPSRHPSLRYVGERLPGFVESHAAAEGIRRRAVWAADLAAFEWARVGVFDAPNGSVMTRDALAGYAPEDFGSIEMRVGGWVAQQSFSHPVDMLWEAARAGDVLPEADGGGSIALLVWRKDERVLHRRAESIEASALSCLAGGKTFADLCEWAATQRGEHEAPALAAGWLDQWVRDGLLIDCRASNPNA